MRTISFFKQIIFVLSVVLFVSCDKDFDTVGDGLIGDNHFGLNRMTSNVLAYNEAITPIQSDNLPVNPLGIYNNSAFGTTTANFVTQVSLATISPAIGKNPTIDSVYIDIPYFSKLQSTAANGTHVYTLDSIHGALLSKIKLSIYESNRNMLNATGTPQAFYTNQNSEFDSFKKGSPLNNDVRPSQNSDFFFNPKENRIQLDTKDPTTAVVTTTYTYTVPSMHLRLDADFFKNKILLAPASKLAVDEVFKEYFRGLYFKVENSGVDAGSMAMMNFAGGKITIKFKEDLLTTVGTETKLTRVDNSIVLNLTGNTASLLEQSNPNINYINAINSPNRSAGDDRLYLKGGQGSVAVVNLFGTADSYKYVLRVDGSGKAIDENGKLIPVDSGGNPLTGYYLTYLKSNGSNNVPDALDDLRFPSIDDSSGQIYHSTKRRYLINEANLVFNIDAEAMANSKEPQRIYLYDFKNNRPIVDYYLDVTTATLPKSSKLIFGGNILRDATTAKRGLNYKVRITDHVRNLVKYADSTNVKLGVAVTESIDIVTSSKIKVPNAFISQAPKSSVMNPLGTILYGNNVNANDESKKLKLEIYFTKPN